MSTSTESCHDLDMADPESRENVYSSASSYSTYSREVKYIFNPADDSIEDYSDYSHINTSTKQNHVPRNPHTPTTSSQVSGKENRTPRNIRNDHAFELHASTLRSGSSYSNNSRDRGPIPSHVDEEVYTLATHYGHIPGKPNAQSENYARERTYFSPRSDITSYPYSRHSIQVWKNTNGNGNSSIPLHHQNVQKQSNTHHDVHPRHSRNNGPVLNTFHTQHPLVNSHNSSHYQQPSIHHSAGASESSYQQKSHSTANNQQGHEPPYPMPPRYNHQHHARRKTWSPPTLKMSILNASSQGHRVCYSNDSLDISDDAGLERKTQSLSEDLDVTPPKLAPISGVLAQKPGPNLIRPIAFKPIQTNPASPLGHVKRHQHEVDIYANGAHDRERSQTLKQDNNLQNGRSNLGAFNSMTKFQYHNSSGGNHFSSSSDQDSFNHSQSFSNQHNYSSSSSNNRQHNSSINNHHNVSSNNTYTNIPVTLSLSANSSSLSTFNENSFASESSRNSAGTEPTQPASVLRVSFHAAEGALQVPSPSDSGVGELEAILREKDAEINTLREVMDRNERAIFQVYEERKHSWLQSTQEIQNDYECKMKAQSRKAYKTEQVLSLQVYKLQQEQKTLFEEKEMAINERDLLKQQVEDNENQISELKLALEAALATGKNNDINLKDEKPTDALTLEEENSKDNVSLKEELTLKNKEFIVLKSKLHNFQTDVEKKNKELAERAKEITVKSEEIKVLKDELNRLRDPPVFIEASSQTHAPSEVVTSENIKPSLLGEGTWTISGLQEELADVLSQVNLLKEEHEKERQLWLDEKNRVVRYQKQLQLNYVQMQRKNVTLETEVQQLTLELESRDMKLIALTGEESVC